MPRTRKPSPAELKLKRENDVLALKLCRLNYEFSNKQDYTNKLEVLLRERLQRIDELNGKLEQARAQNRRLDEENERLVEMVRLPQSPSF